MLMAGLGSTRSIMYVSGIRIFMLLVINSNSKLKMQLKQKSRSDGFLIKEKKQSAAIN